MPFTPKFVDLVRNHTSVTGAGPVALGTAVAGFTGFADAVGAGEQFYYCIQGVDKPAEREVGRGTMQADGKIARQPIAGAPTNFTTGGKTIALVAAAEWFARLDQMSAGGTSETVVESRTALAAIAAADGDARLLSEAGREGLFVFDGGNLSTKVTADPRQGMFVAPASAPTGASGAWVRRFDGPASVRWFGAVGDGLTDDLPAFEGALSALRTLAPVDNAAQFKSTPKLHVPTPAKHYYLSNTLNIHQHIHLFGDGSGAPNSQGTTLRFGDNINGIVINDYRTHGDGVGSVGDAAGSLIEGLTLLGGNVGYNGSTFIHGDGTSASGHGVRIRGVRGRLKDIQAKFFAGDGFNIFAVSGAGSGAGADAEGNANDWYIEDCWALYNDGCGLQVRGPDANAGTSINFSAIQNRLWGIWDRSFLGNTHVQPHVRDNGVVSSTGLNLPQGMCSHAGNYYCVVVGQEAAASTTVPGSNEAVWALVHSGGHPYAKPWASGMAWEAGGAYATDNASPGNSRTTFVNPYAESGQGLIQAAHPALFLHGLLATGMIGTGAWLRAVGGDVVSQRFKTDDGTGIGGGNDLLFHELASGDSWRWTKVNSNGKLSLQFNGNSLAAFEASGDANPATTTLQRLRIAPPGSGAVAGGYEVGFVAAAGDLNGRALLAGDVFHYSNPSIGGPVGLICTTAGIAGTTAVLTEFGEIGARAPVNRAATAYTAQASDAGAYIRFTSEAAVTFTIPPSSSAALPVGAAIEIEQAGGGALTVEAGPGVTVNSRGGDLTLAGQYSVAMVKKTGADSWTLTGDL